MVIWPSGFFINYVVAGDISQFVNSERTEIGTFWPHHTIRHTVEKVSPSIQITVTGSGRMRQTITKQAAMISSLGIHSHSIPRGIHILII
jgi:hypothetical protein